MQTDSRFFSRTYDETMALLVASRDYLAAMRPATAPGLSPLDSLRVNCEAMRVTARLTQIMAWLLAQRAVHEGEMTRDRANDEFRLPAQAPCLTDDEAPAGLVPKRLRELLDQSHRLYIRVARLDEFARRPMPGTA